MSKTQTVLLVEDELGIAESVAYMLQQERFAVLHAEDLSGAWRLLTGCPDCIVLDLKLPDGNGLDLLRQLRKDDNMVPVIVLTSRDSEVDRVVGLELGADDYVSKPFSVRELVARVKAVLRRSGADCGRAKIRAGELLLDSGKRSASFCGVTLELTKIEFDLLVVLAHKPGQVFPRERLLDLVWGQQVAVTDRTVDVHIKGLRKKLTAAGAPRDFIETVRGVGYRKSE